MCRGWATVTVTLQWPWPSSDLDPWQQQINIYVCIYYMAAASMNTSLGLGTSVKWRPLYGNPWIIVISRSVFVRHWASYFKSGIKSWHKYIAIMLHLELKLCLGEIITTTVIITIITIIMTITIAIIAYTPLGLEGKKL